MCMCGVSVSVCVGLNVKFLVAATGEKLNPQSKIVAAIAELVVSDWTMRFRCSASLSLSHTLTLT
jgi:hypothetical protein